jgi:hypothetical protein
MLQMQGYILYNNFSTVLLSPHTTISSSSPPFMINQSYTIPFDLHPLLLEHRSQLVERVHLREVVRAADALGGEDNVRDGAPAGEAAEDVLDDLSVLCEK